MPHSDLKWRQPEKKFPKNKDNTKKEDNTKNEDSPKNEDEEHLKKEEDNDNLKGQNEIFLWLNIPFTR